MKLFAEATKHSRTTRYPPTEAVRLAQQGRALVIVETDFDEQLVPKGYVKLKLNTPDRQNFIGLVPQLAFFYLDSHNLGNGGIDEGLEALTALYDAIEEENDLLGDSRINAGGVDLAVTVRNNYQTLITNKLLDGHEKKKPIFDEDEISRLCLDDAYVKDRMRGIAAIALGKTKSDVKAMNLTDVLGFKSTEVVERISRDDMRAIADHERTSNMPTKRDHMVCRGDSYWYLKPEYREGQDGWSYNLQTGEKTRTEITPANLATIEQLETEIFDHQKAKGKGTIMPIDRNTTRMAVNLMYGARLDVSPVYRKK